MTSATSNPMSLFNVRQIYSNGTAFDAVVAYNSDLTVAQVTAAVRRRVKNLHGKRLVSVSVTYAGPSGTANQRGMV